jgi:hypothetical protein
VANRDTILAYIDAPIVRLGDGDPAPIVPALAAAATLLTVVGAQRLAAAAILVGTGSRRRTNEDDLSAQYLTVALRRR